MSQIIIFHDGNKVDELKLVEGEVYSIGRSSACDISLKAKKGISRKHLKIYQEPKEGLWVVECISRIQNLKCAGQVVSSIELEDDLEFSASSFVFSYTHLQKAEKQLVGEDKKPENTSKGIVNNFPVPQQHPALATYSGPQDETIDIGSTKLKSSDFQAFLKISGTESGHNTIIQLEGQLWVGGRDESCEIHIDDTKASRKHFEISKVGVDYFISDLESANGTEVNGQLLVPNKHVRLLSGDTIAIMDVQLSFEIRDTAFEEKFDVAKRQLEIVPHHLQHPQAHAPFMMPLPPPDFSKNGVFEEKVTNAKNNFLNFFKTGDIKKNAVRILIAVLTPVFIYKIIFSNDQKKEPSKNLSSESNKHAALSDDQKSAIKDMFNLAQQYYTGMKYELCLSELKKLHKIVPNYENSRTVRGFCEQGAILQKQEEDRLAKDQRQAETEQRISTTVEYCRLQKKSSWSLEEARNCLQQGIELSPEHPAIISFLEEISIDLEARQQKIISIKRRAARIRQGKRHIKKAQKFEKLNKLSAAIREYKKFLRSNYPALNQEKAKAKRSLASVENKLKSKVDRLLQECASLKTSGKYKDAYLTCEMATQEDPKHKEAKNLKEETLSELRREMKSIFEDSILEESLGNVDAAKEKWRLIKKNNLPFDDYYKKANRLLKKYEGT